MVRKNNLLSSIIFGIIVLAVIIIPLITFPLSLIYALSFLGFHITFIQAIQISILIAIIGAIFGFTLYAVVIIAYRILLKKKK
jgi:uncharacterized membrane protein YedE/YeeE